MAKRADRDSSDGRVHLDNIFSRGPHVLTEEPVTDGETIGVQFLNYWVGGLKTWLLKHVR